MAANNFFSYPPTAQAGYPANPAAYGVPTAYPPAQVAATGYRAAANAAPQVVTYSAYQPPPTQATITGSYGATGVAAPLAGFNSGYSYAPQVPAAQPVYDASKGSYYGAAPPPTVTYAADPHYQARPVYSANNVVPRPSSVLAGAPTVQRTSYTVAYSHQTNTPTSSYSYHAPAIVAAAQKPNIYVQPQPATINITTMPVAAAVAGKIPSVANWNRGKPSNAAGTAIGQAALANAVGGNRNFKPRVPPKPQQLHYCEVCKISCAGPQTYKEHLEGQKHKKKEASVKQGSSSAPTTRAGNALRCELCDVTCTGSDAYAAHIRGAKHQKVVKLHTKLGKPIPSHDPVLISKEGTAAIKNEHGQIPVIKSIVKHTSIPKITFVKDSMNKSGDSKHAKNEEITIPRLPEEKDVQPVGHEYIEEIRSEDTKALSFNCKLCDCRFNDPNAKEMHMKGRRHRLQYKKKVNPGLIVDVKPSLRQRKLAEDRAKRSTMAREEFWKRREEEFVMMEEAERAYWEEQRCFEDETMECYDWFRNKSSLDKTSNSRFGASMHAPHPFGFPPMMRRPETVDDRNVLAKHSEIFPGDEDLSTIQKIVSTTEKALKLVSDSLAENSSTKPRILKGVMKVGILAKGLVLKGDTRVRLVLLCGQKPTLKLLEEIAGSLPKFLKEIAPTEAYTVVKEPVESGLLIASKKLSVNVQISLTSPIMRDTISPNPQGVLNPEKCLEALAALRHAKWFQARAAGRQSCVMVIRVLRDFCNRVPTWQPLELFSLELMVEKVLASAGVPLSPGDAFRRVFEAVANGLLLSDSPGLLDPCEKEPRDASASLTSQEREDITASAQHALRLIAFRQIHSVLDIDPNVASKFTTKGRFSRKRRHDEEEPEPNDGKKDKKDT